MPLSWSDQLPHAPLLLGALALPGWVIKQTGQRVVWVDLYGKRRGDDVPVISTSGVIPDYTYVHGTWRSPGVAPADTLIPDWTDDATRMLTVLALARLYWPSARWSTVLNGWLISDCERVQLPWVASGDEEEQIISGFHAARIKARLPLRSPLPPLRLVD